MSQRKTSPFPPIRFERGRSLNGKEVNKHQQGEFIDCHVRLSPSRVEEEECPTTITADTT